MVNKKSFDMSLKCFLTWKLSGAANDRNINANLSRKRQNPLYGNLLNMDSFIDSNLHIFSKINLLNMDTLLVMTIFAGQSCVPD